MCCTAPRKSHPRCKPWSDTDMRLVKLAVSVVLDASRHLDPSLILEEFRCRGLNCSSTPYRTSDLGVPTARRRHCVSGAKPPFSPDLEALGRLQVPTPPSLKLVPLDEGLFLKGKVTVEPTIMTTGDPWLPHPAGHFHDETGKRLLHSESGPACAITGRPDPLKGYGGTLLLVDGGHARALSGKEVAGILGLSPADYLGCISQSSEEDVHLALAREPGWQAAASVIGWVEEQLNRPDPTEEKAGNCIDPADQEALAQLEVWLQAWKRSPSDPKSQLTLIPRKLRPHGLEPSSHRDSSLEALSEIRVGGRPKSTPKSLTSLGHRKLVQPRFQTATGPRFAGLQDLDRWRQEAVLSKLADSTRKAYGTGWRHWEVFMSGTGVSPFLEGETRVERLADEQWLIRFVVFLHEVMGRTAQGIRQRLSAIRYAHIAAGFPDPLQGRVRLWASLQGLP